MSDSLYIETRWIKMPSEQAGFAWWARAIIILDGEEVIRRAVRLTNDSADLTMRSAIAMACNDFAMEVLVDIRPGSPVIYPGVEASTAPA